MRNVKFGFCYEHFAALWLDVKAENPVCGLSTFLQTMKSVRFPSPCAQIEKARVTPNHNTAKVRKNWLRPETVARPEFTWLTYQDNVENRGRASEATLVWFLCQDNVLQNLAIHFKFALPVPRSPRKTLAPFFEHLKKSQGLSF